jgi:hypothetical protein
MSDNPNRYVKLCSDCNRYHDSRYGCDAEALAEHTAEKIYGHEKRKDEIIDFIRGSPSTFFRWFGKD